VTIGNENYGIKGNLVSIEFPIGGVVEICVTGKLNCGDTYATGSECIKETIVETDT